MESRARTFSRRSWLDPQESRAYRVYPCRVLDKSNFVWSALRRTIRDDKTKNSRRSRREENQNSVDANTVPLSCRNSNDIAMLKQLAINPANLKVLPLHLAILCALLQHIQRRFIRPEPICVAITMRVWSLQGNTEVISTRSHTHSVTTAYHKEPTHRINHHGSVNVASGLHSFHAETHIMSVVGGRKCLIRELFLWGFYDTTVGY